ncbi:MAG: hypothetical protein GY928_18255 [Colwellia sp.]|nr:hypothetical protein [Colwellia sp.]
MAGNAGHGKMQFNGLVIANSGIVQAGKSGNVTANILICRANSKLQASTESDIVQISVWNDTAQNLAAKLSPSSNPIRFMICQSDISPSEVGSPYNFTHKNYFIKRVQNSQTATDVPAQKGCKVPARLSIKRLKFKGGKKTKFALDFSNVFISIKGLYFFFLFVFVYISVRKITSHTDVFHPQQPSDDTDVKTPETSLTSSRPGPHTICGVIVNSRRGRTYPNQTKLTLVDGPTNTNACIFTIQDTSSVEQWKDMPEVGSAVVIIGVKPPKSAGKGKVPYCYGGVRMATLFLKTCVTLSGRCKELEKKWNVNGQTDLWNGKLDSGVCDLSQATYITYPKFGELKTRVEQNGESLPQKYEFCFMSPFTITTIANMTHCTFDQNGTKKFRISANVQYEFVNESGSEGDEYERHDLGGFNMTIWDDKAQVLIGCTAEEFLKLDGVEQDNKLLGITHQNDKDYWVKLKSTEWKGQTKLNVEYVHSQDTMVESDSSKEDESSHSSDKNDSATKPIVKGTETAIEKTD